MKKTFTLIFVIFFIIISFCFALTTQEWWINEAERCNKESNRILYWVEKRSASEAQGHADLCFAFRGQGFLSYVLVNDGPWPKIAFCSVAKFAEDGSCSLLGRFKSTWKKSEEMPLWIPLAIAPPSIANIYGVTWISKFIEEGPQGFDYGVFEGNLKMFYQNVIKKFVNMYNKEMLTL